MKPGFLSFPARRRHFIVKSIFKVSSVLLFSVCILLASIPAYANDDTSYAQKERDTNDSKVVRSVNYASVNVDSTAYRTVIKDTGRPINHRYRLSIDFNTRWHANVRAFGKNHERLIWEEVNSFTLSDPGYKEYNFGKDVYSVEVKLDSTLPVIVRGSYAAATCIVTKL